MSTSSFETLSVLGVITGLSLGKIDDTSNLILFMTGHTYDELKADWERAHEDRQLNLDMLAEKCRPALREQFPELAEVQPPNIFRTPRHEFDAWEDEQVARFGTHLDVRPL